MKNLKYIFLISIIILSASYALSMPKFSENKSKVAPDPIYNNTIMVPQGYILNVSLKDNLNCETISIFDDISAILNNDFIYKGVLIAPEGSIVTGKIVKKEYENNNCKIKTKFTNIITSENVNIPISALFVGQNKNGYIFSDKNSNSFTINNTDIIMKQPVTYIIRMH